MKISKSPKQKSRIMGTIMILAWTLIIGPLGGILIGAATYFMLQEKIVVAGACVAVILLPALLTTIWAFGAWTETILNKGRDKDAFVRKSGDIAPFSLTQ